MENEKEKTNSKYLYIPYILVFAFLITGGLYLSRQNYLLFHSFVEFFSIIISFSIFVIAFNTRTISKNDFFAFTGLAFGFIGAFDLLHTLAYKGMGVFPGNSANLPTQLWIIARSMQSISLLFAFVFLFKKINLKYALSSFFFIASILLFILFYLKVFPDCYIEGKGLTLFKITAEYIISGIMLVNIFLLFQNRARFHQQIFLLLIFSFIFMIISEVFFTHYLLVYDIFNMLGHCFKVISFYLLYKAVIAINLKNPYQLLFFEMEKKNALLKNYNSKISSELKFASSLQYSIEAPDIIEDKEFYTYTKNIHCEEMAGDYLDIFRIKDFVYIISADISGHGLIASLFIFMLKAIIKTLLSKPISGDQLMNLVSNEMKKYLVDDYFFTMNILVINLKEKHLSFTTAGHPPFIIFNKNEVKVYQERSSFISNLIPTSWGSRTVNLAPNDKILVFTDGIFEIVTDEGKMLGLHHIENFIRNNSFLPSHIIIEELIQNIKKASKKEKFTDDISVCIFEQKESTLPSNRNNRHSF